MKALVITYMFSGTEDRAKIDYPFLFRISGFPTIRSPIRLLCLGAFGGSYGQRPPKISLLRHRVLM